MDGCQQFESSKCRSIVLNKYLTRTAYLSTHFDHFGTRMLVSKRWRDNNEIFLDRGTFSSSGPPTHYTGFYFYFLFERMSWLVNKTLQKSAKFCRVKLCNSHPSMSFLFAIRPILKNIQHTLNWKVAAVPNFISAESQGGRAQERPAG